MFVLVGWVVVWGGGFCGGGVVECRDGVGGGGGGGGGVGVLSALTGPTESVRYGVAPEIYGRAAGLIPAEIGEPKVGR
ncbi:hypothetical protein Q2406_09105 [Klebsiella pneumoniae]|nr:hypothetical protein [Klebsiella pneumoniae]